MNVPTKLRPWAPWSLRFQRDGSHNTSGQQSWSGLHVAGRCQVKAVHARRSCVVLWDQHRSGKGTAVCGNTSQSQERGLGGRLRGPGLPFGCCIHPFPRICLKPYMPN